MFEKSLAPPSGGTKRVRGPMSRMTGGVAKAHNVLKFRRTQAPRSAARRPRRNLEMTPYENARSGMMSITRARGKNTNDGVEKTPPHTAWSESRLRDVRSVSDDRKGVPMVKNHVGDETGSRNMAVITATGESTASPY